MRLAQGLRAADALQGMGHLGDEDRAGRADGVAMCDRTAVDVEARRINLQFVAHDDSNRRMTVISVVVGSMRQGRLSEKPAQWILQHLKKRGGIDARLLDLRGLHHEYSIAATPATA